MTGREPVDIDPEVLADPLGEDDSEEIEVKAEEVAADSPQRGAGTALSSATGRGLVPFDPFRRYMVELKKYPPLTREQEVELARRYRDQGDKDALFRLVTSNLILVVRIALSFRRAARNLLDLIQEGNLGLLQAVDRFDPELGVRLPTYAAWWVRAYMVKFLLDNVRQVRVGTTNARRKLLRNLRKEKLRLEQKGYEVGPKQLAEHFGVSEDDVRDVQAALESRDVALDAPPGSERGSSPAETLPADQPTAEEIAARQQLQERTEAAIARFREELSERETAILDERLLSESPMTLQLLGDRFGTSREAVRQGEVRLKRKLTEFLREELGDLGSIRIGST